MFEDDSEVGERCMYFPNDWYIFCFGFQCRDAGLLAVDVENQVVFLHRLDDGIQLFNVLDSVLRIRSDLS